MRRRLDIILLADVSSVPPPDQDFSAELHSEAWKTEAHLLRALTAAGHTVRLIGLYNDLHPLLAALQTRRPDLVFNVAEQFNDRPFLERNIPALLELLQLPYTGTGPTGLTLCKHKALAKKLLAYHRVHTPHFATFPRQRRTKRPANLHFPLFVKGVREEGSVGISKASFVATEEALAERVTFIHDKLGQDALVEEFIEGREFFLSILGNRRLRVFPLRELHFGNIPPDEPRFATFRMKWDEEYRKRWHIKTTFAAPLPAGLEARIAHVGRRVYRILQIEGFGRIDLRVRPNGDIVVLEANPNPFIAADEDFALSAQKGGLEYAALLRRIIDLALQQHGEK